MERLSAPNAPIQVIEAKAAEDAIDVPVEAVASVIVSGANSIQRDNQGLPQGSSSVSPSSPSFNLPPIERAQLLHRSLELIQAGSGTSPRIPPARYSQEPGTAISMSAPIVARRNNLNPSVQVPTDPRTEDELRHRDELQRFGEACGATVRETREAAQATQVETTRLRQAAANVEREQAANRQAMREGSSEARLQCEASSLVTPTRTTAACTPVMDMLFCINNLAAIRSEAGDFSLKDFSEYWAPDNSKTAPIAPNTFIPSRLMRGNNPLWASYYVSGRTRLGADGSQEADPNYPPYFRVSQELFGRMLQTFKKSYVDRDEQRKTDRRLSNHIDVLTSNVKEGVAVATGMLKDRKDELLRKHDEDMAASQQQIAEASRVYKETVDSHVEALQQSLQGTSSLAQGLKEQTDKLKRMVL
jgi:hypothetical protein